jgi:hypothetical protein
MRARLDGFLLDSFLFEFFVERFGEDSSRNGVPKAATNPHTEANCRWKCCVRRNKLGKAIFNANRRMIGVLRQASAASCPQRSICLFSQRPFCNSTWFRL